ncbi:hypothetical protein AQ808_21140 [Burkholderia pseudomallei]|uniref:hypothetical protein n=1 Tax=Burkholderia pseudomallei TaxID=28450 RepID=UPI00052A6641|nr:hypothetical protein [Burkholderia pseudomallei]AIV81746.1 putative gp43 [Burkholderia pseudomallei MSHR3965]OMW47767.1 hypothetical protein AQ808_21140 [Burkholderia pseudomallei]ONC61138.1 hypothetical protein AQ917_27075 [Burkholderia pseudomallei]
MNDQQQSRADALTGINQFLMDVVTAAGLLSHGRTDKKLATRITDQAYELRKRMYFLAASPVEQPALLTAQDALAAIETFEIVGDNNDSREPNAEDRFILTEFVAHLFGGFRVELPAAAPADGACKRCGSTTAQACNDAGCFYLESGDSEPSAAPADERTASFEAWCDRFPEISAVERLRDAWQEARAAASPAAEAVALTDEGIIQLFEEKADVDLEVYHGIAASTVLSFARALLAAPQPAQASRVTAALQALSADVHTLGDGWANDEAMIGLAKKYLRVEPKPASPELSLWRDFVLLAVTDTAPQPAQADALGEEAYVAKRMTETLATVYATIIGDDEVDTDDGLNAIERVVRAAQVLRLEVDLYRAQADAPDDTHKFKNFHRRLCERFGYVHDEIDWRRDQVSLIEWIAKKADAPAEAREPIAWMTDDDRAITAAQKQRALADGGATASSVRPYSIPCYAVSAPADAGEARLTDAARDMLAERRRQVEAEGWTPEHDDQYQHGAIALAAACYAANAGGVAWADPLPSFWPWMHNWWKPTTPRRDLVKAGALILAELERLDRAALLNGADHDR